MVSVYMKGQSSLTCKTNFNIWIKLKYLRYQNIVKYHHWKILFIGIGILGLCWLGFKSMEFDKNLMDIWIYNSSRLHNETSFIASKSGDQMEFGSIETILQVSRNNLLSPEYLLEHLQLMRHIVNLSLRYDGKVFTFSHFCQKIHLPRMHTINKDLWVHIENIMPCRIITPLNCFWEGSKLLDQDTKISIPRDETYSQSVRIDWKTFNIYANFLQSFKNEFYYQFFADLFKEAGIGSGYISKPCIDPTDPYCPHKKQKNLDLASVVNGGCYQIAENLFKYSRSIFLGNNNNGLQSLLLLRSTSDISQSMKSNELDWTESKGQHIVNLWLDELRKTVVKYNMNRPYLSSLRYRNSQFQAQRVRKSSFYVFTNNSLRTVFNQASHDAALLPKYFMSVGAVILFVVTMFASSRNLVRSHCWLAICSGLLLTVAIISGLGLAAAAGIGFSAITIQVIPFLMIGLGLDEVVILTNHYIKALDQFSSKRNSHHPVAQALYECATVLMISFLIKVLILCASTLIPISMMRSFCIQVLFIVVLQTGVNVLLYPCLLHLDSVRRQNHRIDLLCCLLKRQSPVEDPPASLPPPPTSSRKYDCASSSYDLLRSRVIFSTEFTTSPHTMIPNNVHQYCEINPVDISESGRGPTPKSSSRKKNDTNTFDIKTIKNKKHRCCWKFRYRISKTFFHIIVLVPFQITVMLITVLIIVMGLYSAINLHSGLILESIFARDSNEYNYVKYESKTFQIQTFYILTKELDYIYHQDSVMQLHHEITDLRGVETLENGKFWLSSFILWLNGIQNDFDRDVKDRFILLDGNWSSNASKNGLLAMTLMVQDGETINFEKLQTSRLVRADRVDQASFYLLMNVWRSVSVDFDSLPCLLFPKMKPFNMDSFIPDTFRREPQVIRMSSDNLFPDNPLQYVSCKYLYKGQLQKDELGFVETVRSITLKFTDQGVPAMPLGNIFSLSEHYLKIRYQLMTVSIIITIGMFVISLISINHILASFFATILLSSSIFSPVLLMNLYQIPLNATSGVMVLCSGGLGFRFSLFLIVSYVEQTDVQTNHKPTSISMLSPNRCEACPSFLKLGLGRSKQSQLKRAFKDIQCGKAEFSTFIGMAFILMTDINFLWQHFLLLPLTGLVHSLLNYYCLAPILCLYLIPKSKQQARRAPAPKPCTNKSNRRPLRRSETSSSRPHGSHTSRAASRNDNDDNRSFHGKLSIIPEESSSILSSTKSTGSQEHQHAANDSSSSSSQSQETHPHFMKQNVESSLVIHYPCSSRTDTSVPPELAVKTSFKYRQPLGTED